MDMIRRRLRRMKMRSCLTSARHGWEGQGEEGAPSSMQEFEPADGLTVGGFSKKGFATGYEVGERQRVPFEEYKAYVCPQGTGEGGARRKEGCQG